MTQNSCPACGNPFGSLLAKGILMIILGILMMVFTFAAVIVGETLLVVFLIFIGIALLTSGTTFFGEVKRTWWVIVLGILAILLGIMMIIFPGMMLVYTMYFIAAAALVGGVTDLALAIMGKSGQINRVLVAISGILGIALGIIFMLKPLLSALTLAQVGGIFFFAFGLVAIIEAFGLKCAGKKTE